MSDYDSSGQDALSSDSEESFENESDLGNELQDSRQQSRSIDAAAKINGASLLEEPVPADLKDLPLHEDREQRQEQFCGAHLQEPNLGDAEHSTVESSDKSVERPAEEREFLQAESWQQQQDGITASSQWLCEHYQRHCSVKFPCCMQFYSCHHCHNISTACDNEEAKACHATHLKCSYCQHEQEIGEGNARCQKCGREMFAYFCSICKHFTSLGENPHQCEECGICWSHKDKSFHCKACKVCLDKWLEGNHKCCPDSDHDECCICLEDALSGCLISPCSHNVHRENANVAVTQSGIEDNNHGLCLCERCTSFREDKGVSPEVPIIYAASSNSSTQSWADIDDSSADVSLENFTESKSVSWSDCSASSQIPPEADSYAPDEGFVEPEDNLTNHLEDLLHNSCLQTSLDGSNLVEKKSIPADLENPEGAFLLTDKEKHFMQHYGAHLQGHELGNTMSDGVLPGASSPSTSFFEPLLGDFENSRVSVLSNSDHKLTDNSLLALERRVAEASALVERVLRERREHEQFGREIERKEQLIREQRARERREREERELGCTWREGAGVVLTQNGMEVSSSFSYNLWFITCEIIHAGSRY